jgi:F-type H+-transporting ATPase subunit delta
MESRSGTLAEQYARALLDVLERRSERERAACEQEVAALAALAQGSAELRRFLGSPVIDRAAKLRALEHALPEAQPATRRFLEVLVGRGRADLLPEVQAAYERLRDERRQVVVAEVSSAVPLSREAQQRWAETLGRATGREVRLVPRHDPALIAGARTQIGSQVFDSSVQARLGMLRRRLIGD